MPFFSYLKNTLTYTCLSTLGAVMSSSIVAYGFSRITWPGRDILFFVLLSTLMLPFAVIMIPLYVVFADIHWTNTLLPLTGAGQAEPLGPLPKDLLAQAVVRWWGDWLAAKG